MFNFGNFTFVWFILFIGLLLIKYARDCKKAEKKDDHVENENLKNNATVCKSIGLLCILLDIILLLNNNIHSTALQICFTIIGVIISIVIIVVACKGKK